MGGLAPDPVAIAMMGMMEIKSGAEKVGMFLPGLMPQIMGYIAELEALIPRAAQEMDASGSSMPTGVPPEGIPSGMPPSGIPSGVPLPGGGPLPPQPL
jgi:hypothetical protein